MNQKINQLVRNFPKKHIDAFLVTKSINISYLLDYPCEDAWLLVSRQNIFYITDSRYSQEIKKNIKGVQVYQYSRTLAQGVADLCQKYNLKRIGLSESQLYVDQFKKLARALKKKRLVDVGFLVEGLRSIKAPREILSICHAIKIQLKCCRYLKKIIKPGLTEHQVLKSLSQYVLNQNARFSFPPIIASGPHSSYPHAKVTSRKLRRGEPVLVDFGIEFQGYKSDLTRMFFLGKIPQPIRKIYALVAKAQRLAIEKVRPGETARNIDTQARNFFKQNKLDKYFVHSLGHGIGREVHESPSISDKTRCILKEGMIFTVEPGVYFPEQFGIRIEDMVLVTANGCKVLSR